jgi:hypothetical protein
MVFILKLSWKIWTSLGFATVYVLIIQTFVELGLLCVNAKIFYVKVFSITEAIFCFVFILGFDDCNVKWFYSAFGLPDGLFKW